MPMRKRGSLGKKAVKSKEGITKDLQGSSAIMGGATVVLAGQFANKLLQIGDGKVPEDPSTCLIFMPCGQIVNSPDELLSKVYPNIQQNFKDQVWLSHRAILASRNDVVEKLSVTIQKQLPGQDYAYKSIDCILNDNEAVQYPIEFLNSIQTPDLQAHNLILKVGASIMLIRNIDAPCLYNGTRLIVKKLMQHVIQATIQAEESLLDLNEFIQKCIVENDFTQMSRLQVNYKCLIVALEVLINKTGFVLSEEVFKSLINKICFLISTSVQLANVKTKEMAITVLLLLEKVKQGDQKLELDFSLYPPSSILLMYTSKLLEKETYYDIPGAPKELCDSLWTWCCHFKDATPFQEIIQMKTYPYDSLLGVIVSVLPHLTKDEWLESTHLIEEYFKYVDPATVPCDMERLLPQTDHQLYNVIRCLMDCYIYILEDAQHYTSACFTNTVLDLLKHKASPDLYLNIFLDACHLISVTNTLTLHLSFLTNIKKEIIEKLKDKHSKQFYNKMMYYGIKNLPDYPEKSHILQQFQ
ncbi:uncharacterized protein TNCT_385791 [Trichonephila clavata]|uniref:DNA helicase Pif1-like 2B domain-containing protein n=1 Tax=Trichonephila clavata TaxID=2740835 RepID=A0A8X6LAF2_TRICU|nr:uncharacterized protein TNCT_385791 [Trichonephila clavata]